MARTNMNDDIWCRSRHQKHFGIFEHAFQAQHERACMAVCGPFPYRLAENRQVLGQAANSLRKQYFLRIHTVWSGDAMGGYTIIGDDS